MNVGTHDSFDQIKKISKFGQNQTIATPTSHTTEISKSRNSHSILMIFGRIVEPPNLNQKYYWIKIGSLPRPFSLHLKFSNSVVSIKTNLDW